MAMARSEVCWLGAHMAEPARCPAQGQQIWGLSWGQNSSPVADEFSSVGKQDQPETSQGEGNSPRKTNESLKGTGQPARPAVSGSIQPWAA